MDPSFENSCVLHSCLITRFFDFGGITAESGIYRESSVFWRPFEEEDSSRNKERARAAYASRGDRRRPTAVRFTLSKIRSVGG